MKLTDLIGTKVINITESVVLETEYLIVEDKEGNHIRVWMIDGKIRAEVLKR